MSKASERKMNMARLPWVKKLDRPTTCDGIKWSTVALKDIYEHGPLSDPQPPRGIQDKSRCKNRAWWHFKPLKRSYSKEGNYCWKHLIYRGVYGDMLEEARTNKWYQKHGWIKEGQNEQS